MGRRSVHHEEGSGWLPILKQKMLNIREDTRCEYRLVKMITLKNYAHVILLRLSFALCNRKPPIQRHA